jgi:hypothetical protein
MPHQQQGGGTPYKIRGGLSRAVKQKGIRKMIHEQNARKERGRRWTGEATPTASSTTATSASTSTAPSSRLSREAAPSSVASRKGAGEERGQAVKATIGLDLDRFKVNRTRLETMCSTREGGVVAHTAVVAVLIVAVVVVRRSSGSGGVQCVCRSATTTHILTPLLPQVDSFDEDGMRQLFDTADMAALRGTAQRVLCEYVGGEWWGIQHRGRTMGSLKRGQRAHREDP